MIGVFFPTKFEAEDFLKRLNDKSKTTIDGVECYKGIMGNAEVFVAILGIGGAHSAHRTRLVLTKIPLEMVILSGFAGALIPDLKRGRVLIAAEYSTDDLVNFLKLIPGFDIARLHTSPELITSADMKAELGQTSGCQFVDMEMAYVAQVVTEFGLEVLGIRVILDQMEEDLPAELLGKGYDYAAGMTTPARMAAFLIFRPSQAKVLKTFLGQAAEARVKLTDFVEAAVGELA